MDSTCGHALIEQLKPLGSTARNCEEIDSRCDVPNHFRSHGISISDLNVNLVFHIHYLKVHKLQRPTRFSSAELADSRPPLDSIDPDNDEGAHALKSLINVS